MSWSTSLANDVIDRVCGLVLLRKEGFTIPVYVRTPIVKVIYRDRLLHHFIWVTVECGVGCVPSRWGGGRMTIGEHQDPKTLKRSRTVQRSAVQADDFKRREKI